MSLLSSGTSRRTMHSPPKDDYRHGTRRESTRPAVSGISGSVEERQSAPPSEIAAPHAPLGVRHTKEKKNHPRLINPALLHIDVNV
ncbi:hypothetical protein THAOC_01521, partial [Thalassiosira oceanica]